MTKDGRQYAGVAQPVEQLICNQQVGGSNPSTSSRKGDKVQYELCRFFNEINPFGFVKCASRVKYACGRGGLNPIRGKSHDEFIDWLHSYKTDRKDS